MYSGVVYNKVGKIVKYHSEVSCSHVEACQPPIGGWFTCEKSEVDFK